MNPPIALGPCGPVDTVTLDGALPWVLRGNYPAQLAYRTKVLANGCWEFTGRLDASGYGILGKGRTFIAHRLAWELVHGVIPDGLVIDHTCHNYSDCPGGVSCRHRRCVNPAHMETVTIRENVMRGRGCTAVHAAKTHCKYGHEFTVENTRVTPSRPGGRECRECRRRWKREAYQRSKAATA